MVANRVRRFADVNSYAPFYFVKTSGSSWVTTIECSNRATRLAFQCSKSPSVAVIDHVVGTHRQEWLDCQDHALSKHHWLTVIHARNSGLLVKSSTDTMAVQVLDDTKTVAARSLLERSTNLAIPGARLRGLHCVNRCQSRRLQEASRYRSDLSDDDTDSCPKSSHPARPKRPD